MDRQIDARGLACPLPALKAGAALAELAPGDVLTILATDPEAPVDVGALAARGGHGFRAERDGVGTWRLRIAVRPPITIRRATPADAEATARLHVAAWLAAYRGLLPDDVLDGLDVEARTARWRDVLAGDASETLLALAPEPAGFVSVVDPDPDGAAELTALYVDPSRLRAGLGTALLAAARAALRARGAREVVLWHLEGNEPALGFYERHGFRPDGARRTDARLGPHVRLRAAV